MTPVTVIQGNSPVILGQPHGGTFVPDDVRVKLNANGLLLADTDWHIGKLYDGLLPGATVVAANFHRYVIDANRDPEGGSLYPGQNTTGLCTLTDFDGNDIYQPNAQPDVDEINNRMREWHEPYHAALAAEIARIKAMHGIAIVYDCHSIRSVIPFLFEGELSALNIGTDNGKTCAPAIEKLAQQCAAASPYPTVLNGRFRGGWTTRHYGKPDQHMHALQMETAQSAYLETECAPWAYSETKAAQLRTILREILHGIADAALDLKEDR